jgi:hypothetical protein
VTATVVSLPIPFHGLLSVGNPIGVARANESVEIVVGRSGMTLRWCEDEVTAFVEGSRLPRGERGAARECGESDKAHVHGPNTCHAKKNMNITIRERERFRRCQKQ